MPTLKEISPIIEAAKPVAIDYYRLTGKPLGITAEVGEYLAAKHLGLELTDARMPGFDAYGQDKSRIQIKSRSVPENKKLTGRLGSIRLDHEWDTVVFVLMNEFFEPKSMYEADRKSITAAITKPGSIARNKRGMLSISKFISIGRKVWPESGC